MTSTLYRLLKYAKGGPQETRENFTTEALRAAIREDPGPILRVLHTAGVLPASDEPPAVEAETQVRMQSGQLDLVLAVRARVWWREIWVEVKTGAAEHGEQLRNYLAAVATRDEPRPKLVLLGPWPISAPAEFRQIRWSEVVRAARHASATSRLWPELIQFLRETNMADDYDGPVTAREAGSLLDAHALLRKMRRAVRRTARLLVAPEQGQPPILPAGASGRVGRAQTRQCLDNLPITPVSRCRSILATGLSFTSEYYRSTRRWVSTRPIRRPWCGCRTTHAMRTFAQPYSTTLT